MRVLIIGINYRPELTAVGPYTAGLAEHLAARGDEVTVITGIPHYPDWTVAAGARRTLWSREVLGGVRVVRAAHYVPSTQSAIRRAAYEGTFGLTGLLALAAARRPDAILGIVPSLGGGLLARMGATRFGCPYGLLFQDLMGPAAAQSGVPGGGGVARITGAAEAWAMRDASAVAVVADAFRPYVLAAGVRPEAVHHVPNWSRAATPALSPADTRRRFGWQDGEQVVLHAGNMGFKQGLEQVVDAARVAATERQPVRFVFAGGGSRADAIRDLAEDLPNVDVLGVQADGVHASLMAAADVLLLSERATQMDMSLPSKLTSYFASGRPIIAAVPARGASAGEVERSGAGIVVPAGAPAALLAGLARLRADRELSASLAAAGPRYASSRTSAPVCLARAERLMDAIAGRTPAQQQEAA